MYPSKLIVAILLEYSQISEVLGSLLFKATLERPEQLMNSVQSQE